MEGGWGQMTEPAREAATAPSPWPPPLLPPPTASPPTSHSEPVTKCLAFLSDSPHQQRAGGCFYSVLFRGR